MIIHGYEFDEKAKHVAAQGFWFVASKGGKKFFLKQYTPAKPSAETTSPKLYEKKLAAFNKRTAYRTRINQTLRKFSMSGGNIVAPSEEFVEKFPTDDGKEYEFYCEITELIPNVIPDEKLEDHIKGLEQKEKLLILATAAGALNTVHTMGRIVHSDLKLGNVLLAINSNGKTVAKLIDFDGSYFLSDKDTLIAGDEVYCSPELCAFYDDEDDDPELRARLTEKSDIFSLGLIFHKYLSEALPIGVEIPKEIKARDLYCSQVLLCGGKLEISDKITNLKHRLLIQDMLEFDPEKRPTALQVLMSMVHCLLLPCSGCCLPSPVFSTIYTAFVVIFLCLKWFTTIFAICLRKKYTPEMRNRPFPLRRESRLRIWILVMRRTSRCCSGISL